MRVLLLGPDGQVGWELRRALAPLGEVVAVGRAGAGDGCGDLAQPGKLADTVRRVAPDAIVNAAAYTAVDRAESEPELAQAINATAAGALADVARALGACLVHYSTDYVFDGGGTHPWQEDDATGPLNVYGRTKLAGEQAIRDSGCRHLILRTSWVYAARGGNFVRTMLRLAADRERLTVIDDQIGAPTGAELIADVSAHLLHASARQPDLGGTYHLAAAGATSWCGYARHVIDFARVRGKTLAVREVAAITTADYPTPARRPLNSRLDCSRLERAFGLTLPPWQDGVERMLSEILDTP
ncbi:MAG: dTDP-4-dehydrorhamnose reductase [Rhodocyclaceae bacterium]|nr:dTDP-4-dehydrorhamnose reductase [Rhodocyclaceae bacterium]